MSSAAVVTGALRVNVKMYNFGSGSSIIFVLESLIFIFACAFSFQKHCSWCYMHEAPVKSLPILHHSSDPISLGITGPTILMLLNIPRKVEFCERGHYLEP